MRISDWSSDVCSSDLVVDGAVVDIDAFAVGGIHELVAVLDVTRPRRQRLLEQEFGDGELYLLAIPGAEVQFAIEHQENGRAACRESVCQTGRSRWSPWHYKKKERIKQITHAIKT